MQFRFLRLALVVPLIFSAARAVGGGEELPDVPVAALIKAYPNFLDRIDGNDLVWKDGMRMRIDDRKGPKPFDAMLNDPDIKDMFAMTYPAGDKGLAPDVNFDPGRIRYLPLFIKMYGDCRKTNLAAGAGEIVWLPKKYGKTIEFSKLNGAASELQKVSNELDQLSDRFLEYLRPLQGTFNCRTVAGTNRLSSHGTGTAIDLAKAHSHYWFWSKPDASGRIVYKNEVPWEIVRIFEEHGFIWGGKWYHYDTMHFSYRPEMLINAK
jgi:D-alanyl-D-alanine carboxypeptidase